MISVAPILVWAWLSGESPLKAEQSSENIPPASSHSKEQETKLIKPSMTRDKAIEVMMSYGFQPQLPPKPLPDKINIDVQTSKGDGSKLMELIKVSKKIKDDKTKAKNKPILLHFWATWCGPCKKELPHFALFARSQDSYEIYTITAEIRNAHPNDFTKIWDFYENHHIKGLNVCAESSGRLYGLVGGIPVTFVVSPDGIILGCFLGMTDWANKEFADAMVSFAESFDKKQDNCKK